MVPRVQVIIDRVQIAVTGHAENDAYEASERIKGILKSISLDNIYLPSDPGGAIDLTVDAGEYQARVANAIAEIAKGRYTKAIPSRKVPLDFRVDMLATLLHGHRANTPARTFSLNHMGMQATGFSPEVLLSIEDGNVYTEALAGTQLSGSPEASLDPFDNKLHNNAQGGYGACHCYQGVHPSAESDLSSRVNRY